MPRYNVTLYETVSFTHLIQDAMDRSDAIKQALDAFHREGDFAHSCHGLDLGLTQVEELMGNPDEDNTL